VLRHALSIRAGASFSTRETVARYSAGVGVRRGAYRLDYGLHVVTSDFSFPSALSLTCSF
jgi:hypothetical protein